MKTDLENTHIILKDYKQIQETLQKEQKVRNAQTEMIQEQKKVIEAQEQEILDIQR